MRKIKHGLFSQLLLISSIILLVLAAAYGVTRQYVRRTSRSSVLELNEKALTQIQKSAQDFYDSMNHVATTLVYSPTVYRYFTMDSAGRVTSEEDLSTVYLNTMLLDENIAGIYLYDRTMEKISSTGEELEETDSMEFIHERKTQMEFGSTFLLEQSEIASYVIYFPVFDLENVKYGKQIGMCSLIMRAGNFDEMLEGSQATEHTQVYLLDGEGQIVASRGSSVSGKLGQDMKKNTEEYDVQFRSLAMDGWKIVSRIPVNEMEGGTGWMQNFMMVAYMIAGVAVLILIFFCYKRFIKPIHQINEFIRSIVAMPQQRIEVAREDEIGLVMESLNQMLDEKDQMDREMDISRKKMYEVQLAKKQLQVLAYRNQINSHFLYNTFDCIRAMALYYDAEEIAEITMALSHLFRYAVKEENIVQVEEELEYIKEYAKIIEFRFMDKIDVEITADDAALEKPIVKLILQPLVENAVFHGLEQKIEGGEVQVKAKMYDERHLIFTVEDNGCGMKADKLEEVLATLESRESTKGVGMANIYQRLRLFYGEKMEFTVESTWGEGTKVTILVPDEVEDGGVKSV